jgi:hypothetical protein
MESKGRVVIPFDVTGWDQSTQESDGDGPKHSRATVKKEYRGDLEGESTASLLMCQADPSNLAAGAGYVASEVVTGTLGGRAGTFVIQHWGLGGADGNRTGGHIVPGSGTGDLTGITGQIEIDVDADGSHTLILDYELP